jgi:hypothetical protein
VINSTLGVERDHNQLTGWALYIPSMKLKNKTDVSQALACSPTYDHTHSVLPRLNPVTEDSIRLLFEAFE